MKYANVKCKLRRSEAVLENRTKIAEYKNSAVRGHSTEPWECSMFARTNTPLNKFGSVILIFVGLI